LSFSILIFTFSILSVEIFIWLFIFIVSVIALLQGAALFSAAAARFFSKDAAAGFAAIAIGAALPELALALAAVLTGRPELVLPVLLGSSIANILLVAGASAIAAKNLPINRECADADAPLLAAAAAIFCFCAIDGVIVFGEGLLMLVASLACAVFLISRGRVRKFTPRDVVAPSIFGSTPGIVEMVGARFSRGFNHRAKDFPAAVFLGLGGVLLLAVAANFTIESLAGAADLLPVSASILAVSALAIFAAIPELWGSFAVIAKKRYELALGNVFSGVAVNLLLVAGIAAMFSPLPVDAAVLDISLPFLAAAAALLTVSGFSRKINSEQGWLYVLLYALFLSKLFAIF
jgi:cation:H+ antiporter